MPLLLQHLHNTFHTPYQLGRHDCLLFIAAWVDLLTGTAHHPRLQGTYTTLFGALHLHSTPGTHRIRRAFIDRLTADGWQHIPCPEVPPALRTGDIAITARDTPAIYQDILPIPSLVTIPEGLPGHLHLPPSEARHILRHKDEGHSCPSLPHP